MIAEFLQAALPLAETAIQNKMNETQWNRANAYNSPEAQMNRFREAGLNPSLMYQQAQNIPAQPLQQKAPPFGNAIERFLSVQQQKANINQMNAAAKGQTLQNQAQAMQNIETFNNMTNGMGIVPAESVSEYSTNDRYAPYYQEYVQKNKLPILEQERKVAWDTTNAEIQRDRTLSTREKTAASIDMFNKKLAESARQFNQSDVTKRQLTRDVIRQRRDAIDRQIEYKYEQLNEAKRHNEATEDIQNSLAYLQDLRTKADIDLKEQILNDRNQFPLWKTRKRQYKWMPYSNIFGKSGGGDILDAAGKAAIFLK